jgi:ComF family protein
MTLLSLLGTLVQSLCPESCPRCGDESPAGFCGRCGDDFARIADPCPACGLPGPAHACPALAPGWQLDAVRAPFLYAAPLSIQLQRLKFARQRRLGFALGHLLARELGAAATLCDTLVPVPLHPRRLRERTFNQSDEIARPVARCLGLRLTVAGIRRQIHTPAQAGLVRGERLVNLERAFSARGPLAGARIAILDDVITTGATVNALAAVLRAAGASRVEAWGVARTVGPAVPPVADAQPPRNT